MSIVFRGSSAWTHLDLEILVWDSHSHRLSDATYWLLLLRRCLVTHIHAHSYLSDLCTPGRQGVQVIQVSWRPRGKARWQQSLPAHLYRSVTSQCLRWSLLVPGTAMASMLCAHRSAHLSPVLGRQRQGHHLPQQVSPSTVQSLSTGFPLPMKGHLGNPRNLGWPRVRAFALWTVSQSWDHVRTTDYLRTVGPM